MFAERVSHVKPPAGVFAEDDDRAIPESGSAKNSGASEIERPMFVRIANSQSQSSAFFKGENAAQVSRERSCRTARAPAAKESVSTFICRLEILRLLLHLCYKVSCSDKGVFCMSREKVQSRITAKAASLYWAGSSATSIMEVVIP